jgi:plasmid stabilization system protein ParE
MKPYTLLPIAEQELLDSARFYDQANPGTGDRFIDDFLKLMERLGRHPESASRISKRLRVGRLADFPYSIIYRLETERILVVAVGHQSRRPGYWKGRI